MVLGRSCSTALRVGLTLGCLGTSVILTAGAYAKHRNASSLTTEGATPQSCYIALQLEASFAHDLKRPEFVLTNSETTFGRFEALVDRAAPGTSSEYAARVRARVCEEAVFSTMVLFTTYHLIRAVILA